jgi:hypothetical protein
MSKEAWVARSMAYRCIDCGEAIVSLYVSYGEPAVFERPLLCPVHWKRELKNAIEVIIKHPDIGEDEKTRLIARLLDFIEAR